MDKILMTVSCMSVQICVVLLILCIYLRRVYPTLKSLAVGVHRQCTGARTGQVRTRTGQVHIR
jgi:hypothetical protein